MEIFRHTKNGESKVAYEIRGLVPENFLVVFLVVGLLIGYFVRDLYAADTRYDEADLALQKAIALLQAAFVPPDKPLCEKQRARAIELVEKAREKIERTKICVDEP